MSDWLPWIIVAALLIALVGVGFWNLDRDDREMDDEER